MKMRRRPSPLVIVLILAGVLTAIGGILINAVSNAVTFLPLPLTIPLLILVIVAMIGITIWQTHLQEEHTTSLPAIKEDQQRKRLLTKVRSFWITGVLEHSLYNAVLITLGLQEQPDAVMNPWSLVVQEAELPARPLPFGTRITQVYNDAHGELLILGEPGAGKTTLLLELARGLLDQAEGDDDHPIPVVLNLSSWGNKRQALTGWLIEELQAKYQVPRNVSQSWIARDRLLLLLDGLDEVAPGGRLACVSALNEYRQEHNLGSMVVCCRSSEYQEQDTRVLLQNAVVVQPLTQQQIDDYLSAAGQQLEVMREAFHRDAILQELATTPLMLNVLTLAYRETPARDLPSADSLEAQRQQVFAHYTERMLHHRSVHTSYSPQQMLHWLTWLAQQLIEHGQTVFSIDQIQPDWLPSLRMRRLYRNLLMGLAYGAVIGLLVGLSMWLAIVPGIPDDVWSFEPLYGGLYGLVFGLLYGVGIGLINTSETVLYHETAIQRLWAGLKNNFYKLLKSRPVAGLIIGLGSGLFEGHLIGAIYGSQYRYQKGGLFIGAVIGLLVAWVGKLDTAIQPVEALRWKWNKRSPWKAALKRLAVGLAIGLVIASLNIFLLWSVRGPTSLDVYLLVLWTLLIGYILWLILVVSHGFLPGVANGRNFIRPHRKIWLSARSGIYAGTVLGLLTCISLLLVYYGTLWYLGYLRYLGLEGVWPVGLPPGLRYGILGIGLWLSQGDTSYLTASLSVFLFICLAVGLPVGLRWGGFACLQHLLLRLFLWRLDYLPLNDLQFLDHADQCLLLRKVGSNYIFAHRLLLEYFASRETTPISTYSVSIAQVDPEDVLAYYNRGTTSLQIQHYERAIENYSYAIKLGTSGPAVYLNRGLAYDGCHRYEQAIADYTQVIQMNPRFSLAYFRRAYTYLRLKRREPACRDFERYALLKPKSRNGLWMTIYAALGKAPPDNDVIDRLESIAAKHPRNHDSYMCWGVALGIRGKWKEGLRKLERALLLSSHPILQLRLSSSSSEDDHFWKGMLCAYLGHDAEAMEAVEKALEKGLPPLLLTPLYWLEQDRPQFYHEHALPLLTRLNV
jgi:tetratricopeptide (TPR) repeat protein